MGRESPIPSPRRDTETQKVSCHSDVFVRYQCAGRWRALQCARNGRTLFKGLWDLPKAGRACSVQHQCSGSAPHQ